MTYFDHNASSFPSKTHLNTLFKILQQERPANPSSPHNFGRNASVLLTKARKSVAKSLESDVSEIIFTSGGTEANVLGTRGVFEEKIEKLDSPVSIITTALEHPCILKTFETLKNKYTDKVELIILYPNSKGYIDIKDIISSIKENTVLISIIAANNEIGTIQPVKEFGDFLHFMRWGIFSDSFSGSKIEFEEQQKKLEGYLSSKSVLKNLKNLHFHVDSVQIFGKQKTSSWVSAGYDSFAISGHKVGALQGIGALVLRRGHRFLPLLLGGAQEKNRRAGTENLPGIISLGLACDDICTPDYWKRIREVQKMTHIIFDSFIQFNSIIINSQRESALPNTINISFFPEKYRAEDIILKLDLHGICVSSSAACSSGVKLPSHVILATGKSKHLAENTIRISLGVDNTEEEVNNFINYFKLLMEQ